MGHRCGLGLARHLVNYHLPAADGTSSADHRQKLQVCLSAPLAGHTAAQEVLTLGLRTCKAQRAGLLVNTEIPFSRTSGIALDAAPSLNRLQPG